MDAIAFTAALLFLGAASVHDLRTREVPDLLSYGLIIFGVGYGLVKGLLLASWTPPLQMLLGSLCGVALGFGMFYSRQWGGADSKLLMGMGALLGLGFGNYDLALFLVLILLAGAAYGVGYTLFLVAGDWRRFRAGFTTELRGRSVTLLRRAVLLSCFLLLFALILLPRHRIVLAAAIIAIYAFFYLWLLVRTVERSILIKRYPVAKLTEGDWVQEEVTVKGKRLCSPQDPGITLEQIALLKRHKVTSVLVKEGIPFVPSFLLALLLLWLLGPVLQRFLELRF